MSDFGDDFADFEGGGADARGGGSNFDSSPTGQQGPSFSSDSDSGFDYGAQRRAQAEAARISAQKTAQEAAALKAARDADFARQVAAGQTTIGFTDPRGGTTIRGNVIQGGKISGFSNRDLQNEQTLAQFGFGDSNSNAFKQFLSDTGASVKNPFGKKSPGLFGKIFESKDLDYSRSLTPDQRKKTLEANFLNYVNPATKQRFGSILGSAEGEKSLYGDRVKGVRQQSLAEGIAGLGMGTLFPGLGMLEARGRTRFAAPEMLPEGFEQPQGGLLEQFLGGFGGILQPTPDTTIRTIDRIGQAGSNLIQRGREAGSNLTSGIRSLISDPEVDQIVDTVRPNVTTITSGAPPFASMERKTISQPYRTTPEQQRLMQDMSQNMSAAGLSPESRTNFLNDIIGQQMQTTYSIDDNPVLTYTPEGRINPDTGQIYGDDDRAADYQIAAARLLKEPNQSFKLPTR